MSELKAYNELISAILLNLYLGFYLITALQWYSYKLWRVCFHYTRFSWHVFFIFVPWFVYLLFAEFFLIYLIVFGLPFLWLWHKKLDKKLVFTRKIKVFFVFLVFFSILFALLAFKLKLSSSILGLIFALLALKIFDLWQNHNFIKLAQNKLENMPNLNIILITASYGKTSIKNFLYELLQEDFKTYKSPRSVNTLLGIVKDINENLSLDTQIYIAEAGARQKGDILELSELLKPQICIIGEIGQAHLEYFKNKENIRQTKLEALQSPRLKQAFLHSSTLLEEKKGQVFFDTQLSEVKASLEGLSFKLNIKGSKEEFHSNLLGAFNAENLAACIFSALFLGLNLEKIKEKISSLKNVEHRLQIITKEPKFIIDDGFNGNFEGMKQSYELCKSYKGRKVLVTPGIIEVNKAQNKALASIINECFDLVIIIGSSNTELLNTHIKIEKIVLKDKNELINVLANKTKAKDLILFSNDTPSFM